MMRCLPKCRVRQGNMGTYSEEVVKRGRLGHLKQTPELIPQINLVGWIKASDSTQ